MHVSRVNVKSGRFVVVTFCFGFSFWSLSNINFELGHTHHKGYRLLLARVWSYTDHPYGRTWSFIAGNPQIKCMVYRLWLQPLPWNFVKVLSIRWIDFADFINIGHSRCFRELHPAGQPSIAFKFKTRNFIYWRSSNKSNCFTLIHDYRLASFSILECCSQQESVIMRELWNIKVKQLCRLKCCFYAVNLSI